MTTPADIVNRALAQIAARYTVTGSLPTFDGSAAGLAAGILYTPAWKMLLREQDAEFSRLTVTLTVTTTIYPWSNAYLYPSDCLKIRSVVPTVWDQNDPAAVRWSEQDAVIATVPTRIILTNIAAAKLVYTTSNVTEDMWDFSFQEAMVRLLGSELAMALAGRPDLSRVMLGQAGSVLQSGEAKDS